MSTSGFHMCPHTHAHTYTLYTHTYIQTSALTYTHYTHTYNTCIIYTIYTLYTYIHTYILHTHRLYVYQYNNQRRFLKDPMTTLMCIWL